MSTVTEKMSVYEFGRQLLITNDLDPVYVMLWYSGLPRADIQKWLLAYWCFYHVGTASWITDQKYYWRGFEAACRSKDFPRCHERRHFRGDNALKSLEFLRDHGVKSLFQPLTKNEASLQSVMDYIQTWVGFGPWIAFKAADMLERLNLCRIIFPVMWLYDSPREGAELMYEQYKGNLPKEDRIHWAVGALLNNLSEFKAPPRCERRLNVQEAETILCKWKSHMGGRYEIGDDIKAARQGLLFSDAPTGYRLWHGGKRGGLW
jgi:hypothetical protein